eukprot:6083923-Pyramimonas_sp.AAC.1
MYWAGEAGEKIPPPPLGGGPARSSRLRPRPARPSRRSRSSSRPAPTSATPRTSSASLRTRGSGRS